MPTAKEIATMRLDADLLRWFANSAAIRPASTPSCAHICKPI
jgi:hypothetical protein